MLQLQGFAVRQAIWALGKHHSAIGICGLRHITLPNASQSSV
jgi:hypothetical protein